MGDSTNDLQTLMRQLPKVDKLLDGAGGVALLARFSRAELLTAFRAELDDLRARAKSGDLTAVPSDAAVCAAAEARMSRREAQGLCRVINATGVVLHTGLGRAVLPPAAQAALADVAKGYSLLEVDRDSGERGEREQFVRALLCELTGAESATVVNNNAAATMIVLAALCRGRECVVSRGQLVEIGGSFRIPEVMSESGAVLREVGATNRTHLKDYAGAIGEATGMLMRVHTSNFKIAGFAKEVPIAELVALGHERGLLVADDLGSGAMVDLEPHGLSGEPLVSSSIAAGADVVMFSGDKLLGGTQGGLIVGTKDAVAKIRRHPIFRAVRPDKLQLAALEATLRLYRDPDGLKQALPVYGMLTATRAELREQAGVLAAEMMAACPRVVAAVADDVSSPGSGSLPTVEIPTAVVRLTAAECPPAELGRRLRAYATPIFTRIKDDAVVIDLRTLQPGEGAELCAALAQVLAE